MDQHPTISIIIPTYNEAAQIAPLVRYLLRCGTNALREVIVADGGSEDGTLRLAEAAGAKAVVAPGKGRAAQMNHGAALASGDLLYFVHADTYPPAGFAADILEAVAQGFAIGRYRSRFDSKKMILRLNAWFTRFDFFICMGGDQTLFVTRPLFQACSGFREDMKIMEEYEFCQRARRQGRYRILDGDARISARKYDTNSWLRVQLANAKIIRLYKRGASQEEMIRTYRHLLQYRKNAF